MELLRVNKDKRALKYCKKKVSDAPESPCPVLDVSETRSVRCGSWLSCPCRVCICLGLMPSP